MEDPLLVEVHVPLWMKQGIAQQVMEDPLIVAVHVLR